MNIAYAADLHIGARHLTSIDDQELALMQICNVLQVTDTRILVIPGDATHQANPDAATVALLGKWFRELEELGVHVVVVAGNHDPLVPAFAEHFRGRIDVALKPRIVEVKDPRTREIAQIACLPYLPDSWVRASLGGEATREEIANELTVAARDIVLGFLAQRTPGGLMLFAGHGTVGGTQTETGFSMGFIGGTEWRLMAEDLARFDFAGVGHIHRHQAPAPNVVVPGSLLPLDFAETEPKGIVIAHVTAGHPASWTFEPIRSVPVMTHDITLLDAADVDTFVETLGAISEVHDPMGAAVRVIIHLPEAAARLLSPSRVEAAYRSAGARVVKIVLDIQREDRARDGGLTADLDVSHAIGHHLVGLQLSIEERDRLIGLAGDQLHTLSTAGGQAIGGSLEVVALRATDFLGLQHANVALTDEILALAGSVGQGKSSVGCDVLRFALFGQSRAGGRNAERLVRAGADVAQVEVDLRDAQGSLYRVVRKVKVGTRGATTTLDVLAQDTLPIDEWRPISDGKIGSGEAAIAQLLGGLTDDVLCASSIVIQREAAFFTTARPEERRRLLATAAGMGVYDDLQQDARGRRLLAVQAQAVAEATAEPLRSLAAGIRALEATAQECAEQHQFRVDSAAAAAIAVTTARSALEKERERLAARGELQAELRGVQGVVDEIEAQAARLAGDLALAQRVLMNAPGKREREILAGVTSAIAQLETEIDQAQRAAEARASVVERRREIADELADLMQLRRGRWADLSAQLKAARAQKKRLDDARCQVIERIRSKEISACTFLADATADVGSIEDLEQRLAAEEVVPVDELRLQAQIDATVVPMPVLSVAPMQQALAEKRAERERLTAASEQSRVAAVRAQKVVDDEPAQRAELETRLEPVKKQKGVLASRLLMFGASLVERFEMSLQQAESKERLARADVDEWTRRSAAADANLEHARRGAAGLEAAEAKVRAAATEASDWNALVAAWLAVRISVLENSVIPGVEATANEILRRFPYGLQIALRTQRDLKSGAGVAEALDVEVLGGKGGFYELCSGGQRTTIDVALHVAIALVVSRRASTRLRFLFLDEPEGLDEAGRAALGAIVRWISSEFGLRVLLASHHEDLVAAVGGSVIQIQGEPGAAVVEHGVAREMVAA